MYDYMFFMWCCLLFVFCLLLQLPRRISTSGTEECEICFSVYPTSVSITYYQGLAKSHICMKSYMQITQCDLFFTDNDRFRMRTQVLHNLLVRISNNQNHGGGSSKYFSPFSSIAHSNKTKCRRLVTIFCWIYWCFQWDIWFKKNISVLLKTLTCLFVIKQIFFLNNDWKTLLTSSSKINQENHSLRIQMSISIFISLLKNKKKSMGSIVAPYYEIK